MDGLTAKGTPDEQWIIIIQPSSIYHVSQKIPFVPTWGEALCVCVCVCVCVFVCVCVYYERAECSNIRPQSSQLTEPLWTDPGIKSGMSVCELISTLKKKERKKLQTGNE